VNTRPPSPRPSPSPREREIVESLELLGKERASLRSLSPAEGERVG
jgi:hypothetical protein